jgi:hypothetical protein
MSAYNMTRRLERLETRKEADGAVNVIIIYRLDALDELDVARRQAVAQGASILIFIPDNGRSRHD